MKRRTSICCSSKNLCRPQVTELPGIATQMSPPHKCHHRVGLASCILLPYMNNLHFIPKKKTQNLTNKNHPTTTAWLVKKQTVSTYFDAYFKFVQRELIILSGVVVKSLFKRLPPFPPIPQFTEYLKFIIIASRAAQFMALLYMKKSCHKSKKIVI